MVWDPAGNTAYAKPDAFIGQSRRFAILVTDAIKDPQGQSVQGTVQCNGGDYCERVNAAVSMAAPSLAPARIVAASVFTTMSATAFMESARRRLEDAPPAFERVRMLNVSDISAIHWRRQVRISGDLIEDVEFPAPTALLGQVGVGRIAFASFRSPRFLTSDLLMPTVPTGEEVPAPVSADQLQFHVWVPATPQPAGGYPVVIAGHGITDSRFGLATALVAGFMQRGYAIIATNAAGHGYGPESTLRITDKTGNNIDLPGGGRGMDVNNDGKIDAAEGCLTDTPAALLILRDCMRQTALDLLQLSRALHSGADLDGDGTVDLNSDRVGYMGQSLGIFYGSLFMALDPYVRTAVMNSGGGSFTNLLTTSTFRPLFAAALRLAYSSVAQCRSERARRLLRGPAPPLRTRAHR